MELDSPAAERVGWSFIALYTLAFMSTSLLFLAPVLVTLALKVNSLVGIQQAPSGLALVAGTGALLAMFGSPIFGKLSDRTASPFGMRRPWMVIGLVGGSLGILIVALAPDITILLVGWCIAQLLFNALLAAMVAVIPDQVPIGQRGLISGILGVGMPIASVSATFLVNLFTGNQLAMFLAPCAIAGCFILIFAVSAMHNWAFLLGPSFVVGVGNGLILGYLMLRSGLVPRPMALLGLIGGPLLCLAGIAVLFGVVPQGGPQQSLAAMPEFFWELALGIYLTVKGFRPAAAISQPARTATNELIPAI